MAAIVARETEWSVIEAFLDRAEAGPSALVIEGAAGIGKSTLWLAGVAAARARGFRVLASRPAPSERNLANVVLGDLFSKLDATELATLSTPRRRAFEAAMLREEAEEAIDLRTLGVAIGSLLSRLAADGPLLVAIDDDHSVDTTSASTLAFALRRLDEQRISLFVSRRTLETPPVALEDVFPPGAAERVAVGPLSVGALHELVRDRLGIVLSRPMQVRLHEVAGGNAFYALEVARTLSPTTTGAMTLSGLPTRLDGLIEARLDSLDASARDALLLVAAHGRMQTSLLRAASIAGATIEAARRAGVIETVGGAVRFTHPLLASAIYQGASDEARRAAHRRLANIVDDPIHRARHAALSAEEPDRDLANLLESAARLASGRGLSLAAAELAEHAVRLTPPDQGEDGRRRGVAAARAYSAAGDGRRARAIAGDLIAAAAPGRPRAEALLLAADFETPEPAISLLEQALAEAAGALDLEATVQCALAESWYFAMTDRDRGAKHARAAAQLAEALDDDALRANALSILAITLFAPGEREALELAERAYGLAKAVDDPDLQHRVAKRLAHVMAWAGETGRSRAWLNACIAEWADADEAGRGQLLWYLALVELWSGRWADAATHADESVEISQQYGVLTPPDFYPAALLALHRGDFESARSLCERGRAAGGGQPLLASYHGILGACDLWSGDAEAALASFERAAVAEDALGTREPAMREWRREHVEALLRVGRVDEAAALTGEWETTARRLGRERVVAHTVLLRGSIAAARGALADALTMLEEAVERHERVGDPYGRARALLALGTTRRRARQKRAAREAIEASLAGFESLGAAYWADVARGELGRISGRGRIVGLSPSELSVASLVAEGRTNREVASALFLGERTVASHLTHIYAKLGVRSRTELARHLSEEPPPKVPTS